MSSLSRELVFLILQFLEEEKFKEAVHRLEKDSGFFFNMKYFEEKVQSGEWEEVEKYLSGFTKVDDNRYSMKIFFEIRKQKYLEALDRQDKAKAVEILVNDLKVFSTFNEELYKEITQLLILGNFRENEQLSKYGDTKTARSIMLIELKKLIEANPLFRDKLVFPTLKSSRLRTLINQSLNWQHQLCKNPRPNPDIKTLFTDHNCTPPNGPLAPTPVNLPVAAVAKPAAYTPLGAHGPFPPTAAAANANVLAGWMANASASSSVQAAVVTASSIPVPQNQVSILKHPRTPPGTPGMVDYQSNDHEQLMKRLLPAQSVEEVTYPTQRQQAHWSLEDLPRTVAMTIHQGSTVTSMDFHPSRHTLLLVGSSNGEITLWELMLRERLVSKPFKIWDPPTCSLAFQASFAKDASISVSRVTWSPDEKFVGVAFTKHLIHLYAYPASKDLCQNIEIDAHAGGVNDLAFALPNKQLCLVSCGDDKLIKVWDLTGRKLFNFEGHEAPVYSVCPHHKENIQFIFSTAVDGKIKAWLYDHVGSRVDYDAPGHGCTTMLYSADGSRLFSCGTSKDGDSYLVEWNESEGAIKRTYSGFKKKSVGVVQFDTTQNHFLAAGEDSQIKFWDMDDTTVLTSMDAEGGLSSLPRLRFNKEGNLLGVTTADNGFKILANAVGLRYFRAIEAPSFEALRSPIESAAAKVPGSSVVTNVNSVNCKVEMSSPIRPSPILNGADPMSRSMEKPRIVAEDVTDRSKTWQLSEISDAVQCRLVTMPDSNDSSSKVVRLLYTNSGVGVLALGSNGVQKLWKWTRNEQNPSGKATASVVPQHWQPNSGLLMSNDVSGVNLDEAVPCIALSKNDSYVMSACGGKVSLFNMMTFKVMTTFMPPPPASTFLAFHPQDNNIIAIGMEDSTIHIYNVRVDEVKSKLKGHQKRITGLAFSTNLNILVSSGADAQLCVWSIDTWEKMKSITIQIPSGKAPAGDTRVQFHSDQIRLLVVHETQLAIYDVSKMDRTRQWVPQDALPAPISSAAYSYNSQLVYATFCDGNIGVYDADSLRLRCRIAPTVYLSQAALNGQSSYPLVVAVLHFHHPRSPPMEPFLLIPIALVTLFLAYNIYQRLRFKLPPGPRPWPIVGNLYDIKPVRFRCFAEWAQAYGPVISVWFGSTLNVIVSNSELAKEVLKENDQQLADRHRSRSAAKFSRDGKDLIWADYGPHYVKVRKVCTLELFSPKRLESLRPIREDEVTAMVESIFNDSTNSDTKGKSLLVKKYLGAVAFNNITRLAFGKRFVNSEGVMDEQGLEFKAIVANGLKLGASLAMAEHIPWLRWMFPLEEDAFAKHGARRDRLTRAIMEEHTQARQKSGGAKQHFVDALLTLQDKYDLSEDTIIGLLWDMITAGMDTTAISVEWGMAELIKNPRVQQKAQEELDRVIGFERVVTEADFSNLPYLQCVAKEALRLHPPTPLMLPHRANANVKFGGYDIPKGSNVHVNVWAIARDPAVWKNPLEFRPERFLEEDVDMKGHDFRLLPFGAGRRVCPGAQLGINLVTSMLAHLLHHFVWTPPEGIKPEEIDMSENPGLVTYMRSPLQAMAAPRLPAHLYKRMAVDM